MDRGVVILAPRENNNVFERELSTDVRLEEARHSTKYLEFIKNEGIEYAGCEKDAGYTLAIYLVSLGHVVLQVDDLSVIYLPKELEENQYLWLRKNKREIRKMDLSIIDINEDGISHYDEMNLCGEKTFHKYREIIEEKAIYNNKDKDVRK